MKSVVPVIALLALAITAAIAGFVLAGWATQPGPSAIPAPSPAGQEFLPVWINELQHPTPPQVCEPQNLPELMLGCQ